MEKRGVVFCLLALMMMVLTQTALGIASSVLMSILARHLIYRGLI